MKDRYRAEYRALMLSETKEEKTRNNPRPWSFTRRACSHTVLLAPAFLSRLGLNPRNKVLGPSRDSGLLELGVAIGQCNRRRPRRGWWRRRGRDWRGIWAAVALVRRRMSALGMHGRIPQLTPL